MSQLIRLSSVAEQLKASVGRQVARAILIDDDSRIVLIKRTKPGRHRIGQCPLASATATVGTMPPASRPSNKLDNGHAAAAFKTSIKAEHRVRAVSW
jgi:hypothetical protein